MVVTLSFDVEEFDFPFEKGRQIDFATQLEVSTEGLGSILALLDKYSIRATFYVTANYALHKPQLIREIAAAGYEVASHDDDHSIGSKPDPAGSKKVLEQFTDRRFGVPGYISRCSGHVYLDKLESLIRDFRSQGYCFTTTKKYLFTNE